MKADLAPAKTGPAFLARALPTYQAIAGQSLLAWALVALGNFAAQIALRRELNPGEFGSLNTALGAIGLMALPLVALRQAFTNYLAIPHPAVPASRLDDLRAAALPVTETFAWIWGPISLALVFLVTFLVDLPRYSLQIFSVISVAVALAAVLSGAICHAQNLLRLWTGLLIASAMARVVISIGLGSYQPWAESGLAALIVAGLFTLAPIFRARAMELSARLQALRAAYEKDFLLYTGATFSVLLALFLFSSADRLVAQRWLSSAPGMISPYDFDAYQTAGLIARALLWGTQPLLWIVFAERAQLLHTTKASLHFFWIYLAALLLGIVFLFLIPHAVSTLFCGGSIRETQQSHPASFLTAHYIPSLAATMFPLGLLQGLGVFALASRRFPECFTLGGCSLAYTLLLFFCGRQPMLMPTYMLGGAMISITVVLFVGVVRWGRQQP